MSQPDLADKLGITFQQLQKYEAGTNRMTAGRLWDAGKALGIPVENFFAGFGGKSEAANDILHTRAGLELVRYYEDCSEETRKAMYQLCKSMADESRPKARRKSK